MKNYVLLLLPLMVFCTFCEPYGLTEPLLNVVNDDVYFTSSTKESSKKKKTIVEPVVCDLEDCRIEENDLAECLECNEEIDVRDVTISSYRSNRPRGCDDPKELFTCIPPIPLNELTIVIDYDSERMVSGQITDIKGNVYARTSSSLISFEDGKAYLQFREVNPELRERFLRLSVTTAVEARGDLLTVTMNGDLGEGGFTE